MEPYRSHYPNAWRLLENTERMGRLVVGMSTGSAITVEDADRICDIVEFAVSNETEIARRLRQPTRTDVRLTLLSAVKARNRIVLKLGKVETI